MLPKDYLKATKADATGGFFDAGVAMHYTTVGRGDFVWLPANVLVYEMVLKEDVFGVRAAMVTKSNVTAMDVFQ